MNLRQKEEVRLSLDIDSEAMLMRVPRFFLQPVVENALIHGFSQRAGHIRIHAEMRSKVLVIEVKDDGIGMDEEALRALNAKLAAAADAGGSAMDRGAGGAGGAFSGMGLVNVVERMRLLRGERFSMTAESVAGHGTIIRLILAYERADNDV
jgi:two-component system sensor histidine kinase YesM